MGKQKKSTKRCPVSLSRPLITNSSCFLRISSSRSVAIKVLALDRGKTDLLSSFELAGLTPLRAGMAQIVVTFHLDEDLVLRVTAHDRLGNQTEQIYIRDRLPTPPHDARRS